MKYHLLDFFNCHIKIEEAEGLTIVKINNIPRGPWPILEPAVHQWIHQSIQLRMSVYTIFNTISNFLNDEQEGETIINPSAA